MSYLKTKVYFDGSHYIGIPHVEQSWKKRKGKIIPNELEEKVKKLLNVCANKSTKEQIIKELNKQVNDIERTKDIVNNVIEKDKRNRIVRQTRLSRKIGLQQWTHFCTFTYDSSKLSEDEFRVKFLNCIRHLSNRKGWKYIGVFERSPKLKRLHFHGIFVIKEMVGQIEEVKDYSTRIHNMQVTHQNTFFLERFGRNDFKELNPIMTQEAVRYILKYIRKTGEKVIFSRHLQTYFVTDILEDDVVCTIGQEDRKILLFDNFRCTDLSTGEIFGNVNKELIDKLPKAF
ncbi:MAG: hypothetical protein IKQ31_02475 [Clostridia bacterium]|nr:hypothetical protein [Clostridia bacterium]